MQLKRERERDRDGGRKGWKERERKYLDSRCIFSITKTRAMAIRFDFSLYLTPGS